MASRTLKPILILTLMVGISACGQYSSKNEARIYKSEATPGKSGEPLPVGEPTTASGQHKSSAEIITVKTDIPLASFEMPKVLQDHLTLTQPELAPKQSEGFSVYNQYIQIDPDTSVLTFAGVLKIPGKKDEAIQLSCQIDKAKSWSCDNMFPVDAKIAAQRRMQATARCVDAYVCKQVGVKLFVLINGKIETQSFFSYKFQAWKASSGDNEPAPPAAPLPKEEVFDAPQEQPAPDAPVVLEKPTVVEETQATPEEKFQATAIEPEEPSLTDEEIERLLNNEGSEPSTAVEFSTPVATPAPAKGKDSIPQIEQQFPKMNTGIVDQAIGRHGSGRLARATALPASGPGLLTRNPGTSNYGTDLAIKLLVGATKEVDRVVPGKTAIAVGAISKDGGGKLGNHSSHQTGLDIDVAFPSSQRVTSSWEACSPVVTTSSGSKRCGDGAVVKDELDEKRFFLFLKSLNCAQGSPVMAMFLDKRIKAHMCRWAKANLPDLNDKNSCTAKIFRAMFHENGHHNHVHIRLKCPGNDSCTQNMIPLAATTGC